MSIVVVTDSGSDFTPEEARRLGIEVVPVWLIFGEQRLRDGVDIDRAAFARRLRAGDIPKTEPATVDDIKPVFEKHVAAGNQVVFIALSSQLSQSYNNAKTAAAGMRGVFVVDSRGASGLESLLVHYALELARAGVPAEEIAQKADPRNLKYAAYFAVADVAHLGRSGRLPKALVALGSMLNVSLVLRMNEQGAIGPAGQSRSFEKTCEIMVDAVVRSIERSPSARVAVTHVSAPAIAETMKAAITAKLGHAPAFEFVHETPPTIAAHMGEGAVGIFAIVP